MPVGDIVQGYTFVPAEKGIDSTKMNAIAGQAYIAPAFVSGQVQSSSTTTGDYFLLYKANGTLAKILYDDLATSLGNSTGFQQTIWSVRLRSFNSIGNPNFEVVQRNVGAVVTNPASGAWLEDRWVAINAGALSLTMQRQGAGIPGVAIPGTNFSISNAYERITLTTTKATLAATDNVAIRQSVEGPCLRELIGDAHSISLLVRSSVANLKFGIVLTDVSPTRSLSKLCPLGAANTWTLITLPNIPVWPAANFTTAVGLAGYFLYITLCAGSSEVTPANDTWQTGFFPGANGQDNFAANAANSTFDLAFIQHEPGPQCTTLIDCPFSGPNGNLQACQRYYQKSYSYGTAVGTVTDNGVQTGIAIAYTACSGLKFSPTMAKPPTVTLYNRSTGAAGSVVDFGGTTHTGAAANAIADSGFAYITFAPATAGSGSGAMVGFHYTAETGW